MLSEDNSICGLVGVFGDIAFKEERIFKTLLMLDTIRGDHSTGVATLNTQGVFQIAKDSVNAFELIKSKELTKAMGNKLNILMGHNRFATKGAINADNAHPFEFGDVIGAHNGTLKTYHAMYNANKHAVDSKAVFENINHEGIGETWKKLNGAAALTWIDKRDKTINITRNKERELFWCTANNNKTLLWASESWMLHVAAGREGLVITAPKMFPTNTHFKIGFDKELTVTQTVLEEYTVPKWIARPQSSIGSTTYYGGKRHLDKEGLAIDDVVYFKVLRLDDKMGAQNRMFSTVHGVTLKGTPIVIYSVDTSFYDELLTLMWADGGYFSGKICYSSDAGLILNIQTVLYEFHSDAIGDTIKCDCCMSNIPSHEIEVQPSGKRLCIECAEDLKAISH